MKSIKLEVKDFNTKHIFDCGQCFRWRELEDGSYTGVAIDRIVNMKEEKGILTITPIALPEGAKRSDEISIWHDYLDLGRDYGRIKRTLSNADPDVAKAIKAGGGIRILKQELWETIVSFIISQNNNIPRIKGCIEALSEKYGKPVAGMSRKEARALEKELPGGLKPYNIPAAKVMAKLSIDDLKEIKLGYRDKYLIETSKRVLEEGYPSNMKELLSLPGVGPKVANCILLFGLGKMDSFPIDTWVVQVMHEIYGFAEEDMNGMMDFAQERFGDLSGFAQQYLFYYIREKNS